MSKLRQVAASLAMTLALGTATAAQADVIFGYEITIDAPIGYYYEPMVSAGFGVTAPVRVTGFDVGIGLYNGSLTPPTSGFTLELYQLGASSPFFSQTPFELTPVATAPGYTPYVSHILHGEVAGPTLAPGDYRMVLRTGVVSLIPLFAPSRGPGLTLYGEAATAPEPATWALMLLGFGGLGLALRGRRGALA